MIEWVAIGLGVALGTAIVGWIRERQNAKEWEIVCMTLNHEYGRIQTELYDKQSRTVHEQVTRWVN